MATSFLLSFLGLLRASLRHCVLGFWSSAFVFRGHGWQPLNSSSSAVNMKGSRIRLPVFSLQACAGDRASTTQCQGGLWTFPRTSLLHQSGWSALCLIRNELTATAQFGLYEAGSAPKHSQLRPNIVCDVLTFGTRACLGQQLDLSLTNLCWKKFTLCA